MKKSRNSDYQQVHHHHTDDLLHRILNYEVPNLITTDAKGIAIMTLDRHNNVAGLNRLI